MRLSDYAEVAGFAYPTKVRTACTAMGDIPAQTWTTTGGAHLVDFLAFKFTENPGTTGNGSAALVEHFRTLPTLGS
ncbi:hypothetical protein [Nocardia sp. NPDC058497]|uniref:hypothetical protein n=1 Tax=Nocardia sp. NPDC058497 TaxID=3346529 RepID=UPI0036507A88